MFQNGVYSEAEPESKEDGEGVQGSLASDTAGKHPCIKW
jgi:hypothetical protein